MGSGMKTGEWWFSAQIIQMTAMEAVMKQTGFVFAGVISSFLLTHIDVMGAEPADQRRVAGCGNEVKYDVVELTGLEPFTFRAHGLNNAGQVVGGIFSDTLFRWDDGEILTLTFPGMIAVGEAINEDGVVVGFLHDPQGGGEGLEDRAVIWFPDTGEHVILDTPVNVFPWAISDNLMVAGLSGDNVEGFAFDTKTNLYTPLLFGDPPDQGVGSSGGRGLNSSNIVVGSEVVYEPRPENPEIPPAWYAKPFLWTEAGGMVELALDPVGNSGRAVDINENNEIVGIWFDEYFAHRPAMWLNGGTELVDLDVPVNYFVAESTAVNDNGQVTIIAPNDWFGYTRGFMWEKGVYNDLSAQIPCEAGVDVHTVEDINNAGEMLASTKPIGAGQGVPIDWVILRPIAKPNPADLDGDGSVGASDLAILLGSWGPCPPEGDCPADLDSDGQVGASDLAILLGSWG